MGLQEPGLALMTCVLFMDSVLVAGAQGKVVGMSFPASGRREFA